MNNPASAATEVGAAVGKLSPPIAVVTATLAGMTLQHWVLIATLIYTAIQSFVTLSRHLRERKKD